MHNSCTNSGDTRVIGIRGLTGLEDSHTVHNDMEAASKIGRRYFEGQRNLLSARKIKLLESLVVQTSVHHESDGLFGRVRVCVEVNRGEAFQDQGFIMSDSDVEG